jgi:hypothetical protein
VGGRERGVRGIIGEGAEGLVAGAERKRGGWRRIGRGGKGGMEACVRINALALYDFSRGYV